VEYLPVSALSHLLPIEFNVLGAGQDYVDLANTMLYVKAKIIRENNAYIDDTDEVAPVNLTLHSLFNEVEFKLSDTLISSTNNTYAYRALFETLLSYGKDAKESQLTAALYYKDRAGYMEDSALDAAAMNTGMITHRRLFVDSREVDMMGKIHADLFFQDKFLPADVGFRLRLLRNKDAFCLMSSQQNEVYKLLITECKLFVRKIKLSPSVFMAHARILQEGHAKYPIRRVVCKTFTVPAGNLNFSHESLFTGQLPTRLVVGIVDNESFCGSYRRNPFNFKNYDLTQLALYMDGQQQHIKPLDVDYDHGLYMPAYLSLFGGTNKLFRDEGLDIDRSEYPHGYSLYAFDLTPDLAESDHFNLSKEGNVRLDAKFSTALPNTVNVICFAEFENVIEIDRNKNVIYDYTN